MLQTLRKFNRQLEALAMEVAGLRAVVTSQARQLAAVHEERYAPQPVPVPAAYPRRRSGDTARGQRRIN